MLFKIRYASKICSVVIPYLESPGLSMMPLLNVNTPPGLYLQLIVSGSLPRICSTKSICVMSSRLIIAPSFAARAYSSSGVSLEENIISSPLAPIASQSISSVSEEQSQPQPYSRKMSTKNGFGVALIAKYSRNPGFQENASFTLFAFSRIPFSS